MNATSENVSPNRDWQYLTTALLLVSGFISLRACFVLPRAKQLLMDLGLELSFLSQVVMNHHQSLLLITLMVFVGSMVSVWWRYPLHSLVVALGLVWLWLGAHLISMAANEPMRRLVEGISEV